GVIVQSVTQNVFANDPGAQALGFDSAPALLTATLEATRDKARLMDESGEPLPLDHLLARLALQGEQKAEIVVRYCAPHGGKERWALTTARTLMGRIQGEQLLAIIFHDITHIKRAEWTQRQAILQERRGIARELHDSLAQVLVYINAQALAVEKRLHEGAATRAAEEIAQMARVARMAYTTVREDILGLRMALGRGQDM